MVVFANQNLLRILVNDQSHARAQVQSIGIAMQASQSAKRGARVWGFCFGNFARFCCFCAGFGNFGGRRFLSTRTCLSRTVSRHSQQQEGQNACLEDDVEFALEKCQNGTFNAQSHCWVFSKFNASKL